MAEHDKDLGTVKSIASPPSVPSPPRWHRRAYMTAGAVALAAAVALLLLRRPPGPLPPFTASFEGGASLHAAPPASAMADPSSVVSLGPGARVAVTLRPAKPVGADVVVRPFVAAKGAVLAWEGARVTPKDGA